MNTNKFSVRVKPMEGETLSSFLSRAANGNGSGLHAFWNSYRGEKSDCVKVSDLLRVDFVPYYLLDINRFIRDLNIEEADLLQLTLANLLHNMCGSSNVEHSRFLRGMVREELAYCPICLKEGGYYRINWRFSCIHYCTKHETELLTSCPDCKRKIRYCDSIMMLSRCPHCNLNLADQTVRRIEDKTNLYRQKSYEIILNQLLSDNSKRIEPCELAVRILFVLNDLNAEFSRKRIEKNLSASSIEYLLQHARGTIAQKRTLHFSLVLEILGHRGISYDDVYFLDVPREFRMMISKKMYPKFSHASCLAKWCTNYGVCGSLQKTGTSNKHLKGGEYLTHYLFCSECGCEYAFEDDRLIERTYFIRGYECIQKYNLNDLSIPQVSNIINLSHHKCRTIIAYFKSRGILAADPIQLKNELLNKFLKAIEGNVKLPVIEAWECWENRDYYFRYRYHPKVIESLHLRSIKQPARINKERLLEQLVHACDEFIQGDRTITIGIIAGHIKVSSATLVNWGYNEYIHQAKQRQVSIRYEQRMSELYQQVDEIFNNCSDTKLTSNELYERLGVSQSYLRDFSQDVNEYIYTKKSEHLKQIRLRSLV